MTKVISIASGKGGVGKTTVTANLGTALAQEGNKVAVIDGDTGLRNLDVLLGLENRIIYNLIDLANKECEPRQALIQDKHNDNLYLLPTSQQKNKNAISKRMMRKVIKTLKGNKLEFDYILIDAPAGIEKGFQNATAVADEIIIVATPEMSSIRDADRVVGLLNAENLDKQHLIVNRIKADMVHKGEMLGLDEMIDILSINVLGLIPESRRITISTNRGLTILNEENEYKIQKHFKNIAKRINGQEIPLLDIREKETWASKFKKIIGLGG